MAKKYSNNKDKVKIDKKLYNINDIIFMCFSYHSLDPNGAYLLIKLNGEERSINGTYAMKVFKRIKISKAGGHHKLTGYDNSIINRLNW